MTIMNLPKICRKYVVARYADCALWYWGSYDYLDEAERTADTVGGVVVVKE